MIDLVAEQSPLGGLERWLLDPAVTELMVNGGNEVWVERAGRLERVGSIRPGTLLGAIEHILAPLGRRLDRTHPTVDARLDDGSRLCAVVEPVAVDGPCLNIRRFSTRPIPLGAFASPPVAALLRDLVARRCNVLVSGPTSSGKTTLLNALASEVEPAARLITLEDVAELRLPHPTSCGWKLARQRPMVSAKSPSPTSCARRCECDRIDSLSARSAAARPCTYCKHSTPATTVRWPRSTRTARSTRSNDWPRWCCTRWATGRSQPCISTSDAPSTLSFTSCAASTVADESQRWPRSSVGRRSGCDLSRVATTWSTLSGEVADDRAGRCCIVVCCRRLGAPAAAGTRRTLNRQDCSTSTREGRCAHGARVGRAPGRHIVGGAHREFVAAAVRHAVSERLPHGQLVTATATLADVDEGGAATDADEAVVVQALRAAHALGGPTAATLDAASALLRERAVIRAEALAFSAQARLSARVLTAVPLVFAGWSALSSRNFRSALVSPIGLASAALGAACNLVGWWWMRRIVAKAVA